MSELKRAWRRQADSPRLSSKVNINLDLKELDCKNLECIQPV